MKTIRFLATTLAGIALALAAQAQVTISTLTTYSQNFDTLSSTTGASPAWAEAPASPTLQGWYIRDTLTTPPTAIPGGDYNVDTGSTDSGDVYSYGSTSASDRALGGISSSSGNFAASYGLQLLNSTGQTITSVTVIYDGEQWRRPGTSGAVDSMTVGYQVGTSSLSLATSTGWTGVSALTFTAPIAGTSSGAALDGNAAANRVNDLTATLSSLGWDNGEYLWIKWVDIELGSDTSSIRDAGMAIDNLTVSFVPEPSTYAALLGLATLAVVLARRRFRRS
jgi:hypothetical protein